MSKNKSARRKKGRRCSSAQACSDGQKWSSVDQTNVRKQAQKPYIAHVGLRSRSWLVKIRLRLLRLWCRRLGWCRHRRRYDDGREESEMLRSCCLSWSAGDWSRPGSGGGSISISIVGLMAMGDSWIIGGLMDPKPPKPLLSPLVRSESGPSEPALPNE